MKRIVLILMIFLSLLSCEKDKNKENNEIKDNKITGRVALTDVFGEEIKELHGVSISLNDEYFVKTDSLGEFEFMNIPIGIYTMKIEKDAFEPLKCIEIDYLGNDTILPLNRAVYTLSRFPQIEYLDFSIDSNGYALVTGKCLNNITDIINPTLDIILLGDTINCVDKDNYGYYSPGIGLISVNSDGTFHKDFNVHNIYVQTDHLKHYYRVYVTSKGSSNNYLGTGCNFYICSDISSDLVEYFQR